MADAGADLGQVGPVYMQGNGDTGTRVATRWMSPGGANPATVPGGFCRRVISVRYWPPGPGAKTSSCSMPCRTPVTHHDTWS